MIQDQSNKKRKGYPREMARKILNEYFLRNSPFQLPIPVKEIATFYGYEIYQLDSLGEHQRALKRELKEENRKLIGLNRNYHPHNQRFSIGHELGHHFLGHPIEDDCEQNEIKIFNQEADEFSAELLMPLDHLKEKLKILKDPNKVAQLFDVSVEALWIKIQNQNLISFLS